jgi:hypothetical protein
MSAGCRETEAALRSQEAEALAAAAEHARECAACDAELREWQELSAAARSLRGGWDSPGLWPRIEASLAAHAARAPLWRRVVAPHGGWSARVPLLAASLAIVALAAALWTARPAAIPSLDPAQVERRLLSEKALREVERAESAYVRAIGGLEPQAEPILRDPRSPLLASYRERLLLIDEAIAECRAQIQRNRFNAHLRRELLSAYQQKRLTLEQALEEGANAL